MCRAAKIKPGHLVIDPMAGSAMIPIEGGLMHPNAIFLAGDISQNELKIAKKILIIIPSLVMLYLSNGTLKDYPSKTVLWTLSFPIFHLDTDT